MSNFMNLNRRNFMKTAIGTVSAVAAPAIWSSAAAQTRRLTIGGAGGINNDAYMEAFCIPYFQETGVEVIVAERRENPYAEVRAMVETGSYRWDFGADIAHDVAVSLGDQGFLESLDLSGETEAIPDSMKSEHFISAVAIAFILAYRTDRFSKPMSYADMWATERYPGHRGLRRNARDTLQVALVADGVAPADVTTVLADEAGWQRAFAKLDEIKEDIAVWWTSAGQTPTLLQSSEVDICPTFNQRAQSVIDTGSPVAITWDGSFYNNYGWIVPKGHPKADMIREFITYCSNPERQAVLGDRLGAGPSNPNAIDYIDPERVETLPTFPNNMKGMAQLDFEFWGPIQVEATNRFDDWLRSN